MILIVSQHRAFMRTSVDVTKAANLSLHLNSVNVTCFPRHVTKESPIL